MLSWTLFFVCVLKNFVFYTFFRQQDAQEFLRYLLEGIHEDVNRITHKPKAVILDDNRLDSKKWVPSPLPHFCSLSLFFLVLGVCVCVCV